MIKLLVFDLGGVILPFEHKKIAYRLHEKSALKDEMGPEDIFNFLFDSNYGLANPYEEGKMSSLEFFENLNRKFQLELSFEEFKEIWNPIFSEDKEVEEIIKTLKKRGYPLFLLSNTNELHFSYIRENYPVVYLLDKWILSYQIGAKKPKKAIYDAVLQNVSLSPKEIFYVDDTPAYVEAALTLGMEAVLHTGAKNLREALAERGVELE